MTLAPAPLRSQAPVDYGITAEAWAVSLGQFEIDMVALGAAVAASEAGASASAAAAAASQAATVASALLASGAANNRGLWSALSGALAIPASCVHNGQVWVLNTATANVATDQPGVSAKWTQLYPPKRYALFDANTINKAADTTGEFLHNAMVSTGLSNLVGICGNSTIGLIAYSGTSGNTVAHSTDGGRTWVLRTMPATTVWTVTSTADKFIAFTPTVPANAYVSANGIAWGAAIPLSTGGSVGTNGGVTGYAAGITGKVFVAGNSNGFYGVSTDNAVTFASIANPAVFAGGAYFSGGLFVGYVSGASYYTSATGLAASWTSRTLPGSCDKMTQDTNGDLLAWAFASTLLPIYRSTNGGLNWTSTGIAPVKANTMVRSINGVLFQASSAGGSFTHHGKGWVWRSAPFDMTSADKFMAKSGNALVVVQSGGSYVFIIDPTVADAASGLWE